MLCAKLFSCLYLQCQDAYNDSSQTRWNMFTYDLGTMFQNLGHSYTRSLYWQRKQWAQFGAVLGETGLVYLADDDTSRFIRNNR